MMASRKNENSVDLNSKLQKTPIAVVGVSALFPDAKNKGEFWNNIINEVDSIIDVPESRWKIDDYYDPDPKTPDKTYCKRGGFIPDIDFNPMEFGLPPNFLEVTDVSQLLALVVARDVLKDAGYGDEQKYDRDKIGITLGVGGGQKLITPLTTRLQYPIWKRVLTNSGVSEKDTEKIIEKINKAYIPWEENSFPGMLGNVISGRVANRLNLGGTNCVLDAACAGSLTALKMAMSDLLEERSEMMITGGVDTDNSPFMYLCFSKTPAFTKDDRVKSFDADSKGMLVGEGVGMVLLKRLEDAKRDNDNIYAVIKGIGTSSDGKFKSIYAPRPEGQVKALRNAYENAGYPPSSIGLVEAHGTGTAAGDNAEFKALRMAFGENTDDRQYIALGSVKSQIGHTKSAAGSAGFIKAVLALHHKILPATINITTPHPDMDVENTPFYVNSETRPWFPSKKGYPRRAGVSAFGFGGTNFHVTLEEYTKSHSGRYRHHDVPSSVVIKANNSISLLEKCKSIKAGLNSDKRESVYWDLIVENSICPVEKKDARVGFVVSSVDEALALLEIVISKLDLNIELEQFTHPKGIYFRSCGMDTKGHVVSLFSGQGSQYVNMGKTIAMNFPVVKDAFAEMDQIFIQDGKERLTDYVFPIPKFNSPDKKKDQSEITKTENAQPAIGTLSAGFYKIFKNAGFESDFTAGHSFGELTALWASGVIAEKDFYYLAMSRGKAMAAPEDDSFDAGTMIAVMGKIDNLEDEIKEYSDITIANYNSNQQVVVAGSKDAILKITPVLADKGYKVIPLPVSAAFHTKLVGHAQKPFAKAIDTIKFKKPNLPVFSNSTSEKYPEETEEIKKILKNHILNPVRFRSEIENIYGAGGRIFVEFGPKNVLAKLVGNILADREHVAIAVNTSPKGCSDKEMRKSAVELCVYGIALSDIDPYMILPEKPEVKKAGLMNIRLNGSNYVSEKTRKAFEDSLKDGFKIKQAKPEIITKEIQVPVEKIVTIIKEVPLMETSGSETNDSKIKESPNNRSKQGEIVMKKDSSNPAHDMETIQNTIEHFFNQQTQTLSVHAQHVSNAGDYTRSFHELMGKQLELVKQNPEVKIPENIGRSMEMFHQYHGETLKVHANYLKQSSDAAVSALDLVKTTHFSEDQRSQPLTQKLAPTLEPAVPPVTSISPVIPEPVLEPVPVILPAEEPVLEKSIPEKSIPQKSIPLVAAFEKPSATALATTLATTPATTPEIDVKELTRVMLEVVSDKTGYPVEMLELEMDMEADLGIDSIKRVEILAAVTEGFPGLPQLNPDELSELKTLGEIVDKMKGSEPVQPLVEATTIATTPATALATTSATTPEIDVKELTRVMLEVVSDKTGYPVEMLELEMDMEADLGIDSIKRVEILAAVTEGFPGLPQLNPDELAELKTLGEIVDKMKGSEPVQPLVEATTIATTPATTLATTSATTPEIDVKELTRVMLEVVSDKTGYPVEMLELEMDMEADLGIDSIKRVEILAAVTEGFPGLPQLNPDELSELKTLGEIVDKMGNVGEEVGPDLITAASIKADPGKLISIDGDEKENQFFKTKGTKRSLAILKSIPAPDMLDFSLNDGDCCLITDDGTSLTSLLATALEKRGFNPVVVSYPASVVKTQTGEDDGIKREVLSDMGEKTLADLYSKIEKNYGKVGGFIHLSPKPSKSEEEISFSENEKELLLSVFLSAKHLKKSLTEKRGDRQFFVVAPRMDGKLGTTGINTSLVSGGYFGLTKTLNLEWQDVFCRTIDVCRELSGEDACLAIEREILDPDKRVTETAIGKEGRFTMEAICASPEFEEEENSISSNSVFLVSGGAKGVTFECIHKLAEETKCRFILLGRSVYSGTPDPDWAAGITDSAKLKKAVMLELKNKGENPTPKLIDEMIKPVLSDREISSALEKLKIAGAKAEYVSADVTDGNAVRKSIQNAVKEMGEITGIIHGAGVLADKFIEDKTIEDFNAVYSTKVIGLESLLGCVQPEKLSHVALFSSAAGFFGNEGQSDYAIANDILNKASYKIKALFPKCHVNSFCWGPWDGGMVTPALKRMFEQNGIEVIPIENGAALFSEEMRMVESFSQILVGSSMLYAPEIKEVNLKEYKIISPMKLVENNFLYDHSIGGNPVLPTVCATSWMADSCEKLYPGYTFLRCQNYKLFKGIVFDGNEAEKYILNIAETEKSDDIRFNVKITSLDNNGKIINHYSAEIVITKKMPKAEVISDFDLTETNLEDGSVFYENGTLFHGPNFQAIEKLINISDEKLTMECRIPDVSVKDQGNFPIGTFNPYAADVQFQSMLIWVRKFMGAGALPSKAADAFHYANVPLGKKFYVTLNITKKSQSSICADIYTHDENGKVYTSVSGAEVTFSKQLNGLFVKAV